MNTPDLSQLHDFYQPAPPSWMPQTVGWYVVFAILTALLLWFCIRVLQRWIKNRYRRDALRELQLTPVDRLSEILKRTAMVTWPRERAASLTGARWITFLHDTSNLNG